MDDIDNIDYNELFGLEPDTETAPGANEEDVAEPSTETPEVDNADDPDETEQEPAEPAQGTDTVDTAPDGQTEPPAQSPDENARFASARRDAERERDLAIAQAKTEATAQMDSMVKQLGLRDEQTGKPIESKAEFDAYQTHMEQERKGQFMRDLGITEGQYKQMVAELPEVKQAVAVTQQAQQAVLATRQMQARVRMEEEVAEITKVDPTVSSIGDIAKMDNYKDVMARVHGGMTLLDAYKLTNFERLSQQATSAARQAGINTARGKDHMTATQARGAGAVTVPRTIAEEYRMLDPTMTDAQIQKHYAKYKSK